MQAKETEWFRLNDATSGRYFYANPKDGSCSWYPPDGLILDDAVPTWWEIYDDQSKLPYYYSNETQETLWDFPKEAGTFPIPLSSYDDSMINNKLGKYIEIKTNDIPEHIEEHEYEETNITEPSQDEEHPVEVTLEIPTSQDESSHLDEDLKAADLVIKEHFEEHEDSRTGHKYYLHKKSRKLTWTKLEAYESIVGLPEPPPPLNDTPVVSISKSSSHDSISKNDHLKDQSKIKRKRASAFYFKSNDTSGRNSVYDLLKDSSLYEEDEVQNKPKLVTSKSVEFIEKPQKHPPSIPLVSTDNTDAWEEVVHENNSDNDSEIVEVVSHNDNPTEVVTEHVSPIEPIPIPKKSTPPSKLPPTPPKKVAKLPPTLQPIETVKETIPLPPKKPNSPLPKLPTKKAPPVPPKKLFNPPPPVNGTPKQDQPFNPIIKTPPSTPKKLSHSHGGVSVNISHNSQEQITQSPNFQNDYSKMGPQIPKITRKPIFNSDGNQYQRRSMAPTTQPSKINYQKNHSEKQIHLRLSLSPEATSPRTMPKELKKEINSFRLEGYAQQYFKNVKKGIFRRNVPVRDLIVWSKESMKTSLLNLNTKFQKKALMTYKNIQIWMGDRSPNLSYEERLKSIDVIVSIGLKHPEIRDELFCQLCKQLTFNPDHESLHKGWALLTLIVQYFPPSKDLEPWLVQFLKDYEIINDEVVRKSVAYALKKIPIMSRQGAVLRLPGSTEIDLALKAALNPTIFGNCLEDILDQHNCNDKVPKILTALISRLKELNSHRVEGIFRISGSTTECTDMRVQIEKGNYDFSQVTDPHVPASVLKQWLRSLEEPIIPADHYWKCIETIKDERMDLLAQVIETLPEANYNVLKVTLQYLQQVAEPENQEYTKMGIQNLAIVFGPNFVRCPSSDPKIILESQQWEQKLIVSLITHVRF